MGVNGKFGNIARDDLLRLADRFAIGPAPKIIDKVLEAISGWPEFARKAGLGSAAIEAIAVDLQLLQKPTVHI